MFDSPGSPGAGSQAAGSSHPDISTTPIPGSLVGVGAAFDSAQRASAQMRAATAAQLESVIALEACDGPAKQFGHNTASWWSLQTGSSKATSHRLVRVARAVRDWLPADTLTRLVRGDVSFDHLVVLVELHNRRIAGQWPALCDGLIHQASMLPFTPWKDMATELARLLDLDGGYDPSKDVLNNKVIMFDTPDGFEIRATFVGEHATIVRQAIEDAAAEQFRAWAHDAKATDGAVEIPPTTTLRALGLAEWLRRGRGRTERSGVVDAQLIIDGSDLDHITDRDGRRVAASDRMCCDPTLRAAIVNSLGEPLDLGRAVRLASSVQRSALKLRDGGCVFPGCDRRPEDCEAHHLVAFAVGGSTDLRMLALLCRRHHMVLHQRGWRLGHKADGSIDGTERLWITTPTGKRLPTQRHFVSQAISVARE